MNGTNKSGLFSTTSNWLQVKGEQLFAQVMETRKRVLELEHPSPNMTGSKPVGEGRAAICPGDGDEEAGAGTRA